MAAVEPRSQHGPKLRTRKHGAAIPLDDLDKRLLNLMQGSFPIAPRPYQHVGAEAGIAERISSTAARSSIRPAAAAALTMAYSPETL